MEAVFQMKKSADVPSVWPSSTGVVSVKTPNLPTSGVMPTPS
jgi:hypothetical protein